MPQNVIHPNMFKTGVLSQAFPFAQPVFRTNFCLRLFLQWIQPFPQYRAHLNLPCASCFAIFFFYGYYFLGKIYVFPLQARYLIGAHACPKVAGIGVNYQLTKSWNIGVNYNAEIRSSELNNNINASIGFRW